MHLLAKRDYYDVIGLSKEASEDEIVELKKRLSELEAVNKMHNKYGTVEQILNQLNELKERLEAGASLIGDNDTRSELNKEVLREFIKMFTKPLDDAYKWSDAYQTANRLLEKLGGSQPPEPFEWIEHHKEKGFFSYGVDTHIIVKREDLYRWFIMSDLEEKKYITEEYNIE